MPRRPSGGRAGGRAAKRPRPHLYLVIEDLVKGYSIRKVDLEKDHGATDAVEQRRRRLPPVTLRIEATPDGPRDFTAAFGTKIVAYHVAARRYAPLFDVRTRCLGFCPRMKGGFQCSPIFIPVGDDKLFCLDWGSFQMLRAPRPVDRPKHPRHEDTEFPEWSPWRRLEIPPITHGLITCHAVHPDGRTIFVSADVEGRDTTGNTITLDTGAKAPRWTFHRGWQLPFKGPASYDGELGAWVGLANDPATLGHVCSCQPPSPEDGICGRQPPAWKLSKEKLFSCQDDPAGERHAGATLVYLGTESKFCLVHCVSLDGYGKRRHLLRLTTFSLELDGNGDLRITSRRLVRSFRLPKAVLEIRSEFFTKPVAFWM